MTVVDGNTFEQLPRFIAGLPFDEVDKLLKLYRSALTVVFEDPEICRWLVENLNFLQKSVIPLLFKLDSSSS